MPPKRKVAKKAVSFLDESGKKLVSNKNATDDIDKALLLLRNQNRHIITNEKVPVRWLISGDEFTKKQKLSKSSTSKTQSVGPTDQEVAEYMLKRFGNLDSEQNIEQNKSTRLNKSNRLSNSTKPNQQTNKMKATKNLKKANDKANIPDSGGDRGNSTEEESFVVTPVSPDRKPINQRVIHQKVIHQKVTKTKGRPRKDSLSPSPALPIIILDPPTTSARSNTRPPLDHQETFKCEHCRRAYKDADSLKKHIANLHSNLVRSGKIRLTR